MPEFAITNADFRQVTLPRADLLLCDPPYDLSKVYDGVEEKGSFASWVNALNSWTSAPWRLFFAPPMTAWSMADLDERPHRVIYWCKTFVQLRRLRGWQYAVTPILVYRDTGAQWYGSDRAVEDFDWITAASGIADLKATRKWKDVYSGGHPGVTGTPISRRLISVLTQPGDLVADPMCGLGSIPVAALQLGRDAFGVELSPTYSTVARNWCAENGVPALVTNALAIPDTMKETTALWKEATWHAAR